MARTTKPPPDYAAGLQHDFDRWDYLKTYGGSDPLWPDGLNMNLVRNHILADKRLIEKNMRPEEYPEISAVKRPRKLNRII